MAFPRQKLTSIERDVIDCEIMLKSAWLMVLKAVWMADNRKPNALESSMSKVKAGDVGTKITQKVVEILGPLGYSREFLLEKWFRDAKITDIYEGTGQINRSGCCETDPGLQWSRIEVMQVNRYDSHVCARPVYMCTCFPVYPKERTMTYQINKAVVIGAGTMGAAIAAHLANTGVSVTLLDIVPKDAPEGNKAARNKIVTEAVGSLSQGEARQPDGRQPEDAGLARQPGR